MTAAEMAAAARGFVQGTGHQPAHTRASDRTHNRGTSGLWPRATALLARQALEQGLDDLWGALSPRVREASRHAQLLCLGEFVRDEALVSGARYAWHGLSRACHHQVYELPPTAGELGTWLDAVDRLLAHDPMRG
jgi:hypothetical protein